MFAINQSLDVICILSMSLLLLCLRWVRTRALHQSNSVKELAFTVCEDADSEECESEPQNFDLDTGRDESTSTVLETPEELCSSSETAESPEEASCDFPDSCSDSIRIAGSLAEVKAVRKALFRLGLFKANSSEQFPLNGHWETGHGMRVTIEGKLVRWTQKRASRLRFRDHGRSKCTLDIYGEKTNGCLVLDPVNRSTKQLIWDNGDIWHSLDGGMIGQAHILEQRMTKIESNTAADMAEQLEMRRKLKSASPAGLGLLPECQNLIEMFIGRNEFFFHLQFRTEDSFCSSAIDGFLSSLSGSHGSARLTHQWRCPTSGAVEEATWSNGRCEITQLSFQ